MNDHPDSALYRLQQIDTNSINTDRREALYRLLYSQALDKNYIDIASDSIIAPAVEYFNGSDDEYHKLLALFYYGVICENAQKYPLAVCNYLKAYDIALKENNYFWAGRTALQLTDILDEFELKVDAVKYAKISFDNFAMGVERFIIGLSKKVILADTLAKLVTSLTNMEVQTVVSLWVKATSDIVKLYLDFSGYTDMAIGLGLMIGIKIMENFDYPLSTYSVTSFWRKWHISLSSWFKDYIYIPLGGNRKGKLRKYFNIFVVWFLTGLWHGASWNFILWGLYFGTILVIEKRFFLKFFEKHKIIGNMVTNILVVIGFVFFYNEKNILDIFIKMFTGKGISFTNVSTNYYLLNYFVLLIISFIACTPLLKNIINKCKKNKNLNIVISIVEPIVLIGLLVLSTAFIVDASSNSFLYFRF